MATSDADHKHPNYMAIWAWLAILTAAEVGVAMVAAIPRHILVLVLLVMAIWKAGLVALYFMHLRFEPRRLLIVVLAPLPLAAIMVTMILMEFPS